MNTLPYNIVDRLKEFDSGYQSLTRIGDSDNPIDILQRYVKNSTQNDFIPLLDTFNNNSGFLCNSEKIDLNTLLSESYFKFKTNVTLNIPDGKKSKNYFTVDTTVVDINPVTGDKYNKDITVNSFPLQRMDLAVKNDCESVFLYCNNIKIPDNEILFFNYGSSLDILIPSRYVGPIIDSEDKEVSFFIEKRFPGNEHLYYYKEKMDSVSLTINLPLNGYTSTDKIITLDKFVTFVNKRMINVVTGINYIDRDNIEVTFDGNALGQELELYMFQNVTYKKTYTEDDIKYESRTGLIHYIIPNDYIENELINGPISKYSCSVFHNGYKIYDTDIKQTSRMSFGIPKNLIDPFIKLDLIIEDRQDFIDDTDMEIYGPDYYLPNMLSVDRCIDKLVGIPTNTVFDDPKYYLDFSKTLSDNNIKFNMIENLEKNKIIDDLYNDTDKINKIISDNPYIIRDLFKLFSNDNKTLLVTGNANDVNLSSYLTITNGQKKSYKIYVNYKLVSNNKYTINNENNIDIIILSKDVLSSGVNIVELYQHDEIELLPKYYIDTITSDLSSTTISIPFDTLGFGTDFDIDYVKVLKKSANEKNIIYKDSLKTGYINFTNEVSLLKTATGIEVTINEPYYEFIVMLTTFNYNMTLYAGDDEGSFYDEGDVFLPISLNNNVPLINKDLPQVFVNGKSLIYGDEYIYQTPFDRDNLACSTIIMKRFYEEGDVINIVFSNSNTSKVMAYDNINIDNKYGLLYLSELPVPFSYEYYNLFINGNKMSKFNIDILSDKLIRLKNITYPIRSVLITSNFSVNNSQLQPYVNKYWLTDFEKLLGQIFNNADPSKEFSPQYPDIDSVYESFDDGVDSVNKEPNKPEPESGDSESNILQVLYMKWLAYSNKARTYMRPGENINNIVLNYFSIFVTDIINNTMDIVYDCSKTYVGFNGDVTREGTLYPKDKTTVANKFYTDMMLQAANDISNDIESSSEISREMFENIITGKLANTLYPADIPFGTYKENYVKGSGYLNDVLTIPVSKNSFINNYVDLDGYELKNGMLYYNDVLTLGYHVFENVLYENGVRTIGVVLFNEKLYNDGILYSDFTVYNNFLYFNGSLFYDYALYDDTLYYNARISVGMHIYYNPALNENQIYFDGKPPSGYQLIDGKLYYDGVLTKGYVLYLDNLYYDGILTTGYALYENKLYYNGSITIGYQSYNDKLYLNSILVTEFKNDYIIAENGDAYKNGKKQDGHYEVVIEGQSINLYIDNILDNHPVQKMINYIDSENQKKKYLFIEGILITDYIILEDNFKFTDVSEITASKLKQYFTGYVTNMSRLFEINYTYSTFYIDISSWDTSNVTDMSYMFGNVNSNSAATRISRVYHNMDTSNVTNMSYMFCWCYSLSSAELNKFNMGNVTNTNRMFYRCDDIIQSEFDQIGDWDMRNVVTMDTMFGSCKMVSVNISNWNLERIVNMDNVFNNCQELQNLNMENFKTNNTLLSLSSIFNQCYKLTYIDASKFDVSNINKLDKVFNYCDSLETIDVSGWDTSNVTVMNSVFNICRSLETIDVSGWDTSNVTVMNSVFGACFNLKNIIGFENLNMSKVYDISNLLYGTNMETLILPDMSNGALIDISNAFNNMELLKTIDVSKINTSNVTDMHGVFNGCTSLETIDISSWDTSNVTDMSYMFKSNNIAGALSRYSSLTSLILPETFDTSKVTNMSAMFQGCELLTNIDLSNFDTGNVTDMSYMFDSCSSITSFALPETFDTSKVTTMRGMFIDTNLSSLDFLSNFDTSNVTDMGHMFSSCSSITSFALPENFDTSKVTTMDYMFNQCINLENIVNFDSANLSSLTNVNSMYRGTKISNLNGLLNSSAINITNMERMFDSCLNLISITDFPIITTNVTNISYMFYNCRNLTSIDLSNMDVTNVTTTHSMFYNCQTLTDINISTWRSRTRNIRTMSYMFAYCYVLPPNIINDNNMMSWLLYGSLSCSDMFSRCNYITYDNTTLILLANDWNRETSTNITPVYMT